MHSNMLLHTSFESCAQKMPNSIAISHRDKALSYRDLNSESNKLANYLIEQGVSKGAIVGIYFKPCFEQIISLIAVLKTGAAYLPLDANYPQDRLVYMLKDSDTKFVLMHSSLKLPVNDDIKYIEVDTIKELITDYSSKKIDINNTDLSLCYIIYTSGTTGFPKGVMIEHKSVLNTISQMDDIFSLLSTDNILLNTSLGFDPSVWLLFWPLSTGACVVLSESEKDPEYFCKVIKEKNIRLFHAGPSLFRMLFNHGKISSCDSLKLVIGGGEAWKPSDLKLLKEKLPNCELCNVYGPTEASIHVCYWHSKGSNSKDLEEIPLGKPINKMNILVLDNNRNEIPIGCIGEFYLSGVGLSRGYLNQRELTAEKFPILAYDSESVQYYKTGDLGIKNFDGNFLFRGRVDEQIKLRGFRIEPKEIENQILKLEYVKNAFVIAHNESDNVTKLVAFIVKNDSEHQLTEEVVKAYLKTVFPSFMIPNRCIIIDDMPLTTNHKVDIEALSAIAKQRNFEFNSHKDYLETTSAQDMVINIWKETLKRNHINIKQDFFELGGDSLVALEIIAKINEKFNIDINVTILFEYPSIESFTEYLLSEKMLNVEMHLANTLSSSFDETLWPLSDNQLWLSRMAKGSLSINNIVSTFKVEIEIDTQVFREALKRTCYQHPILGANIIYDNHNNSNMIIRDINIDEIVSFYDVSYMQGHEQIQYLEGHYENLNCKKINLETDLLFKILLFKCSSNQTVIHVFMQHLISDPYSSTLLINDLIKEYQDIINNISNSQTIYRLPFLEYIKHEAAQKNNSDYKNDLKNWVKLFANKNFLINFGKIKDNDLAGSFIQKEFPTPIAQQIKNFTKKAQITQFIFFLAVLKQCLYELYKQEEFGIGINISRRNHLRWSNMIGPLSEQSVSPINFKNIENFNSLLEVTSSNLSKIYVSAVTIEDIYNEITPNLSNHDFFNVLLDYEKREDVSVISGMKVNIIPPKPTPEVRRHLSIRIVDSEDSIKLQVRSRKNIFNDEDISNIINKYFDIANDVTKVKNIA